MAYSSKKVSSGIAKKLSFFERGRPEKQFLPELRSKIDEIKVAKKLDEELNLNFEENVSEKTSMRRRHSKLLKSFFDVVINANELREKHEENKKLAIDKYMAENCINDEEKEELFKQFSGEMDDDFDYILLLYKINSKTLESDERQGLENARKVYVKEMDKHFVEPKFILKSDLQQSHEKYKSLSHDRIREELGKQISPKIINELNQSLEVIYDQYKRQNMTNIPLKSAIGIDLGTTYCCVGVMNRGKVEIIPDIYGFNTSPSYIAFTEDGDKLNGQELQEIVGKVAKEDESVINPWNTIFDVKRMIGRKFIDKHIQEDMKLWPFEVVEENDLLKVKLYNKGNTTLYPEEISGKILKRLKTNAEEKLGYEVKNAVITVPAYFNDSQRAATKDAGALAGLSVLQILNEPTAAAIAYYHQIKDDFSKKVLIYDLGGGTFDVAIVAIERGDIDVIAVGGDTHLGGVDFDQRILSYLLRKFEDNFRKYSRNEKEMKRAMARLRNQCEKSKWILSEMSFAVINIAVLLPDYDFNYKLTRNQFEDLCVDLFKKTIDITEDTLKSANLKASDINDIVLIGGSTKIPKIQQLLKEYFVDKSLNKQIRPDEAVAYGAAIQAALLNDEQFQNSNSSIIHDVLPFSLGIEVLDKSMAVIIPRNSKIPISKSQIFYTAEDNQSYVFIQIFEGENRIAKQNRLLGEFVIEGLPKKAAGQVSVNVSMDIDSEGILHVKGDTDMKSANITIKDHRGRIPAEELKMLISRG